MTERPPTPKTFFLNEHHELARGEKTGGGRPPQYGAIDWVAKGERVSQALKASQREIRQSKDPVREHHFFLIATPAESLPKISKDKRKAPSGTYSETTDYAADHSRVFRRLGVDLIEVGPSGTAVVHATPERLDRLVATASNLAREGDRERARWATIEAFSPVPPEFVQG